MIRHAWLQKHPSPAADAGEFHWYPREGDREIRGSCVERMRGLEPPAVLWELAIGRVVWARPFAATAPTDNRRYVGLVLTIAEVPAQQPVELLAELVVPPAEPWSEANAAVAPASAASWPVEEPIPLDRDGVPVDVPAVVRALISGGAARVGDAGRATLPAWIASIEWWMPPSLAATPRRGTWMAGGGPASRGDRTAEVATAAWRDPAAAGAWRLLVELAEALPSSGEPQRAIDDVAEALATVEDTARFLSDEERRALPGKHALVDVLHAWGRGQLDNCPTAGTLTDRLADSIALHVLAQLVDGGDPDSVLAAVRWHALLPAARRARLFEAVAGRTRSLHALVEAHA
jgi:hypothetical protein